MLMSIVVRYKNNEEDQLTLVNDIFMKCLDNLDKFEVNTSFFGWMKRVATNQVIDDFRKSKKYQQLFKTEEDFSSYDVQGQVEIDESLSADQLQEILDLLSPATRVVFNLFAIDQLSLKEISLELNITYETAKWHLKEARKKLRQCVSKELKIVSADGK